MSESSPEAGYLFDRGRGDQDRLIRSSEVLGQFVTEACVRAGLASGGRAIDIGCGPLGALPALASLVGTEGRVVGLDASGEALALAREILDLPECACDARRRRTPWSRSGVPWRAVNPLGCDDRQEILAEPRIQADGQAAPKDLERLRRRTRGNGRWCHEADVAPAPVNDELTTRLDPVEQPSKRPARLGRRQSAPAGAATFRAI
jgi:hypothetical protein